ncbi:DUF1543 domain-containing protein [Flavobacterium sp. ZT3R25]|uniref:DUF1543 domain-containing protein n=1 Tax=Flavobacterium galactosi TaxID=3398735 RepID=UPI003A8A6642
MEKQLKLYMLMLGCKPIGRFTEQHDIFFGIGNSLKNLIPQMKFFWPEAKGKLHIDAWREVAVVNNYSIEIIPKDLVENTASEKLFFINLGGYKENEFEEYHYKMLSVAKSLGLASKNAKKTTFYKHCGFKGATSHIDEKYGIDVDDFYNVSDIVDKQFKEQYTLKITKSETDLKEDKLHIGYLKLNKITF